MAFPFLLTKDEREALLDRKLTEMKRRNEEALRRHQEIEEDKRRADEYSRLVAKRSKHSRESGGQRGQGSSTLSLSKAQRKKVPRRLLKDVQKEAPPSTGEVRATGEDDQSSFCMSNVQAELEDWDAEIERDNMEKEAAKWAAIISYLPPPSPSPDEYSSALHKMSIAGTLAATLEPYFNDGDHAATPSYFPHDFIGICDPQLSNNVDDTGCESVPIRDNSPSRKDADIIDCVTDGCDATAGDEVDPSHACIQTSAGACSSAEPDPQESPDDDSDDESVFGELPRTPKGSRMDWGTLMELRSVEKAARRRRRAAREGRGTAARPLFL